MGTAVARRSYNERARTRRHDTAANPPETAATPMQSVLRLVIILMLIAIVVSLGSALFHLARGSRDEADSRKMARDLTVRIGLSLALFVLLMAAWYAGLISPHGLGR
jgi:membrane associated rhomboid family serine protease